MARIRPIEDAEASREAQDVLMNRFNDALQIDLEEPGRLGTLRSLRVDPEALRHYIDAVNRWERIP